MAKVEYPDPSTGAASPAAANDESSTYNTNAWALSTDTSNFTTVLFQGMSVTGTGYLYLSQTRLYDVRLGRWISQDSAYSDGSNLYQFVRSDPIGLMDPSGLQATTAPTSGPTTKPTWAHSGSGTWGGGANQVNVVWSLADTSNMAELHRQIGTAPPGIFKLIKATKGKDCNCDSFHWIQYTAASQNGRPYIDPHSHNPWVGIDVGGRDDGIPYTDTSEEQQKIDAGNGTGWRGAVRGLYDPAGTSTIFIDWPSSGGQPNWRHESIVVLVCTKDRKDHVIGSLKFMYSTEPRARFPTMAR